MAVVEASFSPRETDLVKTLKQIFEARARKSVTLFGKEVSVAKTEEELPLSEKLPPTALAQLKGLYQQHLKRKAHRSDALTTLPLLNGIVDKDERGAVGVKRQRVGPDQISVSGSQPAPSANSLQAGPPSYFEEAPTGSPSFEQVEDPRNELCGGGGGGAPLTVFYNGMVYVYDDIPTDKAQAIMILAESANSCISRTNSTDMFTESVAPKEARPAAPSKKRKFTLADLPQARKASLQRFLEKRKDRLFVKERTSAGPSPLPVMKKSPKLEGAQQAGIQIR